MPGFFSRNKNVECPLDQQTRLWMEYAFLWLIDMFGKEIIINKEILLPDVKHFPIRYDGSAATLVQTAEIVALQMDIDINEINLQLYKDKIHTVGSDTFTETNKSSGHHAAGLYFEKDEREKYDVFIEESSLQIPENMVALLAYGFASVILLRDKRTGSNHKFLSDLCTVLFGLGIFNANASFRWFKNFHSWGYESIGYLKQPHWAYALALYAFYRGEVTPLWINYLSPNVKADFKRSEAYINSNKDRIFNEEYKSPSKKESDDLFSGKWIGQYTYGKTYSEKYHGKSEPFTIEIEVVDGSLLGTCTEERLKNIFDEPAFIKGYVESNAIFFTLTYPFLWTAGKDGQIVANKDSPSQNVLYSGEYNGEQFAGKWEIRSVRKDKDGVYYDHSSVGTWSMQKQG